MKKHALLLCILLCLSWLSIPVWAADSSLQLTLKEGDAVYGINGKNVNAEKPFSVNGILMASADMITKALNLELAKAADEKSLTLKYADSSLTMQIGKTDAAGDGTKMTLPLAPVLKNGSIMVPLRFVVEFFGGEVTVDDKTKLVTAVKNFAGDNSIKDFSLLLKKTTKESVGDSYYGWSMQLPKELKISYRSFNGTYTAFESYDESYYLSLSISELKNNTLDTLLAEAIQYASDYTLISQEKGIRDGQAFVKVVYKDDEGLYEDRIFIKSSRIFRLSLEVYDADKYKNNKELSAIMDSFNQEFKKDGKAEDLSDVTPDGYRVYEDKSLKWSIKIPAEWNDYTSDSKRNYISFVETAANETTSTDRMDVRMFSIESGLTLDQWLKDEFQVYKDKYNPKLVKVLNTEDITVNGVKAKKLVSTFKYGNRTDYTYTIYLVGQKYRYEINYISRELNDNPIKQAMINSMLSSFKFTEPDADALGSMIDPDKLPGLSSFKKTENTTPRYSYEVPAGWTETTGNGNIRVYSNKDKTILFTFSYSKDITFDKFIDYYENTLLKTAEVSGAFVNKSKESIREKGAPAKKYINSFTLSGQTYEEQYFVLVKNGYLFTVALDIQDIRASEKNKALLKTLWDSIKIE